LILLFGSDKVLGSTGGCILVIVGVIVAGILSVFFDLVGGHLFAGEWLEALKFTILFGLLFLVIRFLIWTMKKLDE
jgi:hypothetical protein